MLAVCHMNHFSLVCGLICGFVSLASFTVCHVIWPFGNNNTGSADASLKNIFMVINKAALGGILYDVARSCVGKMAHGGVVLDKVITVIDVDAFSVFMHDVWIDRTMLRLTDEMNSVNTRFEILAITAKLMISKDSSSLLM